MSKLCKNGGCLGLIDVLLIYVYADFRISIQFIMVISPCISLCTGPRLVAEVDASCSPDSNV